MYWLAYVVLEVRRLQRQILHARENAKGNVVIAGLQEWMRMITVFFWRAIGSVDHCEDCDDVGSSVVLAALYAYAAMFFSLQEHPVGNVQDLMEVCPSIVHACEEQSLPHSSFL